MSKSFRQKDLDEQVEDIIQFCMNYALPAFWVVLLVGVLIGVHKCDGNKNCDCKKQPEKTVLFTPKKINESTLNFYTAKQMVDNRVKRK